MTTIGTFPHDTRQYRNRWRRWALVGVGIVILLALAAAGLMYWRMNDIPADLDLARTRTSANGTFRATIRPTSEPIPINLIHSWTLHVETADGKPVEDAQITLDGDMPQHGHGMATTPQVGANLGGGDYQIEGMKFQMGGWWVVDFEISAGGKTDRVSFNLILK